VLLILAVSVLLPECGLSVLFSCWDTLAVIATCSVSVAVSLLVAVSKMRPIWLEAESKRPQQDECMLFRRHYF